ncbi:MAG TPA: AIR synthase family protein [Methylomirabilota bacterium]|jgi:hydrogenase expression/formation protein HypE|nr:AIR synthase family protein [Methylomirabilota bacterium]
MASPLPVGKLPAPVLGGLLRRYVRSDPRVVVGPAIGEDAAVLDMGDRYLVATTDPITFVTEDLGWYALVVNANDLAVRGAVPRWFLATCLFPAEGATAADVEALFAELGAGCAELGVALVGGHTEITAGLSRPIVVGAMLGEVAKDRLVTTAGARPGDVLLLTKGVPIEGASIIARARAAELRARGYADAWLARARDARTRLSVLPEARLATDLVPVHAMHDPTEGGIATALWELADAAGVGLVVEAERIPLVPEGATLCREYGLDPLGTIASGALLLAVGPADGGILLHALAREGIDAAFIGRVVPRAAGVVLTRDGTPGPLPRFEQDELTRLLA